MTLLDFAISFFAGALTYFGISWFRSHSLKKQWLDVPNQRSSHENPVPRGAGIVIVLICVSGYIAAAYLTGVHASWPYIAGALLVAGISWLDDLYSIAFVWRLIVHFLAAVLVTTTDGFWIVISFGNGASYSLGSAGIVITVLWIVWVINAYNFMDGIDGIAGIQGLAASISWAAIALRGSNGNYLFSIIIFASLAAFIIHNWSPANVFIGDVGSAFLGYTFAVMPILLTRELKTGTDMLPIASVLILWPFLFDTILTMIQRLSRGEMIWRAHREHLYQRLVISGMSHSKVSSVYGIFAVVSCTAALLLLQGQSVRITIFIYGVLIGLSLFFLFVVARNDRVRLNSSPHGA